MKIRQEGSIERKFWVAVSVVTFGHPAVTLGVVAIGMVLGFAPEAFQAVVPLFLFGMMMLGALVVGFSLYDLFKGRAKLFEIAKLVTGAGFLFLAGAPSCAQLGSCPERVCKVHNRLILIAQPTGYHLALMPFRR